MLSSCSGLKKALPDWVQSNFIEKLKPVSPKMPSMPLGGKLIFLSKNEEDMLGQISCTLSHFADV